MSADISFDSLPAFLAEDRGPSLLLTASVLIVLSTIFVGLRSYARYLTNTPLSIQDVIVPFAWIAEMGLCINGIYMVHNASTGRHIAYIVTVDSARVSEHFKGIMVSELIYPAAVAFPKLLVVLLYLHILTNKYERVAAKSLLVLIAATWFSYTVAAVFQCTPFAFNYDKTIANGRCFNIEAYANSSSIPNIFTDLAVLVLPIRTVWKLKISAARRVGLLLIFFTGGVGIIASIIRTVVFARTLAEAGPLDDSPWNHVTLINWTIIEPGIYLISACALSFKPLFRLFVNALHMKAFISRTKSTFQPNKSYAKKIATTTRKDRSTQHTHSGQDNGFRRLSDESEVSTRKIEVLVTRTVDIEMAPVTRNIYEHGRNKSQTNEEYHVAATRAMR